MLLYFVCPVCALFALVVCDAVYLYMCLCYGLFVLSVYRFHWIVLCVLLCYVLVVVLLVCVFACGVLCCCVLFHWFVVRVCFVVVVSFSCLVSCYGLHAFPVCDCMLYVPSVRSSFFFLCDVVCLFMSLWYGLHSSFVHRFHWFVLCVMFWCFLAFVFGVCVVCGVLCCCVMLRWFVVRVGFVVVVLLLLFAFWSWFECFPCV